jgi:hypothetical protein
LTYSPDDPTRTQWQPTLESALQSTPPMSGSAPPGRSRKSLFWPGFALGFLLLASIACGGLAATLGLNRISLDDIRNGGGAVWTPPPVTAAPPTTVAQIAAPVAGVSDRYPAGAILRNVTNSRVNIRATPGYLGKTAADIIGQIAPGAQMTTLGDSQTADNLTWWRIRYQDAGAVIDGWVAEATASGVQILGQ